MCLLLARGLPPAPSRGRGREGLRAGARVPKRPWRRGRAGGGGQGVPEAPAPAENRWGAALTAAGGLDPRAGHICHFLICVFTPPSSLAFRIGHRPRDRDSASVGLPFGGRGRSTQSIWGGRGGSRPQGPLYLLPARPRPPRPGLPAPALGRALLQRRERKPWVEIAFKKLTC